MQRSWKRIVAFLSATIFSLLFVLSPGMISLAKEEEESGALGATTYKVGDIIKLDWIEVVITELFIKEMGEM